MRVLINPIKQLKVNIHYWVTPVNENHIVCFDIFLSIHYEHYLTIQMETKNSMMPNEAVTLDSIFTSNSVRN